MEMLSTNRIADLVGMDRRTVRRRLRNLTPVRQGVANTYPSDVALALVFSDPDQDPDEDGKVINLNNERAKLARAQTEKAVLEVDALRGRLIPEDEVIEQGQRMVVAFRNRALAIPSKLAPEMVLAETEAEARAALQLAIHEALDEISDYRPAADD